ncbi:MULTISPECIES: Sec-independent protein translocase subunit TatA/TatB [Haloferacaceae]|uniref:Twin-arginine translocase TatA/TatE family subunit n=1 Tax=Halorubrum glutamatedens TaxID=2707018 RepID=A0ABD5QNT9_9EURY|nr:twin-arginine translocase TatA/TatE family subunit [Halobellus captivus]
MSLVGLNEALLIGAGLVVLFWGPKKLPKLARSLGRSKHEYKEAVSEAKKEYEDAVPDADSEVEDAKAG